VQYEYIRTSEQLHEFCERLRQSPIIAWDTEFVSEDTYRPDLCLVQVAAGEALGVIDPREVPDLTPFWNLLCDGDHLSLVHAGREEFRFCLAATGKRPRRLFDTQVAAGLIGLEYPSSYAKLISRMLNQHLAKGETRTDWRHRPLTARQLEYALLDVTYLEPLYQRLMRSLGRLERVSWLDQEMERWQADIEDFEGRENWRRVSGTSGLSDKAMAIVRELWRWREAEAAKQNRPPRRVLRDDLIVELAKRGKADEKQVAAIRGIDRVLSKKHFPTVAECIRVASELPREEWPQRPASQPVTHASLVGQFISTALSSICRSRRIAPGLAGTVQDVRDLVEFRLKGEMPAEEEVPILARGWRAEVVGQTIDRLLSGHLAIRIQDPRAEEPLVLEAIEGSAGPAAPFDGLDP
jgi:ribonuclease D